MLKDYVSRRWTVRQGMVIHVLYYNFAAGRFHTKKLCSRLYSIVVEFYFLKTKIAF